MTRAIRVALAGNPNSGKTTIFNELTGARQHVGNYPGVTVERKEGVRRHGDASLKIVDLPGTYSLTAYSVEERVTRDFVLNEEPDVVVDIIDASNLERNLYLAVQFMELDVPLVLAFNMSDVAAKRGLQFDLAALSELLGAPIVATVGNKGQGVDALLDVVVSVAESEERARPMPVRYGREIEEELDRIAPYVPDDVTAPKRWVALKLLEDDDEVREDLSAATELLERVARSRAHLVTIFGDQPEIVIADRRYGFISGACQEAVRSTVETRHTMSDKIDVVMTSRLLGLPIFLALMYLVFKLTFTVGEPLVGWIDLGFGELADLLTRVMAEGLLRSLLVDGVIGGVGGVLSLLPNIMLLFLAIAVLEDSGYMARAAFIMDHLMHKIGLHGKSFIPMLIGFGCTVPAIMATRTLETRRDRFITILVSPLMSCSARMPVYVLLTGAFFPANRHWVTFSIYLLGIVLAVIMAKIFGRWLLPGESTPFVMELPPYRIPTLKGLGIHMWERGRLYVKKAGTVILAFSLLIWTLSTFPLQGDLEASYAARIQDAGDAETVRQLQYELSERKMASSYAGRIGRTAVPALKPIGLGHWRIGTALFAGFGAKEAVVSTMGTLYSLGEVDAEDAQAHHALQEALVADTSFTPLVAYTFMVFVLIYIPCVAVVAVVKRETNSWRWPMFMIGYTTTLAWIISGVIYWTGRLLGLGLS